MNITSSAFELDGIIPDKFTQYAENRSPPLEFDAIPEDSRSLALIIDDPDAPPEKLTHFVAFNIDPHTTGFEENHIPERVQLGLNSYGQVGYSGPKPAEGEHMYYFRLYALDQHLDLPPGASRQEVERAMSGHVIAQAELFGRYATPVTAP
jgi:Raf kinase inhibitor-like YbhB/YbcL family protein